MNSARASAIQFNRAIAWLLVGMPWAHALLDTPYLLGLLQDFVVLVIHGVISLKLFGLPRAVQDRWMIWLGLSPQGMKPRNTFLLSGWRILLALVAAGLLLPLQAMSLDIHLPQHIAQLLGTLMAQAMLLGVWAGLVLPWLAVAHVYAATRYSSARMGIREPERTATLASVAVVVYVAGHVVNLVT